MRSLFILIIETVSLNLLVQVLHVNGELRDNNVNIRYMLFIRAFLILVWKFWTEFHSTKTKKEGLLIKQYWCETSLNDATKKNSNGLTISLLFCYVLLCLYFVFQLSIDLYRNWCNVFILIIVQSVPVENIVYQTATQSVAVRPTPVPTSLEVIGKGILDK